MKMKNAVFFDIDGTLWDGRMRIPASTIEAIHRLRENGNYAFLCSGRSRASIQDERLLKIGFDGIIAGCGTYIELWDQILYQESIAYEELKETADVLKALKVAVLLEGPDYLYADKEAFQDDPYVDYLAESLGAHLKAIEEYGEGLPINKFSANYRLASQQDLVQALGDKYQLIFHNEEVIEIIPKGFSKATGMEKLCEKLCISPEATYAFGDSANDIEMLTFAKYGIAMGNGSDAAKEAADYVTAPLWEDGIRKGLEHYHLI